MANWQDGRDDRGDRNEGRGRAFDTGPYYGEDRGMEYGGRGNYGAQYGAEFLPPWYGTGYAGAGFYGGPYNGPSGDTGWRGGPEYNEGYGGGYSEHGARGPSEYDGEVFGPDDSMRSYVPDQGRGETYAGRGPRNYQRSDERIREDINEELTRHPGIDATEIDVRVDHGEVTLAGTVQDRQAKYIAEDVAESCAGVRDVRNELRVEQPGPRGSRRKASDRDTAHHTGSAATGTREGSGVRQASSQNTANTASAPGEDGNAVHSSTTQ